MRKILGRTLLPAVFVAGLALGASGGALAQGQYDEVWCASYPGCFRLDVESLVEMKRKVMEVAEPHMGMAMNCYAAHMVPESTAEMKREILAEDDITIQCITQGSVPLPQKAN